MTASTDRRATSGSLAWMAYPFKAYLAVAAVLYTVVGLARFLPRASGYMAVNGPGQASTSPAVFRGAGLLEGWYRFDGNWYHLILAEGYRYDPATQTQSTVAYFPGYPLVVRPVSWVLGDPVLAGIVVTFTAGLVTALLLYRLAQLKLGDDVARWALLGLLLYPYAFYLFGAMYADALFCACVVGAFLLLELDHPIWAGAVGALATATRPVGAAVVVGLVAVAVWRRGGVRRLRPADAGVLLSVGGLLAWSAYLWQRFDDPFLFADIQEAWGQEPGPSTWLKHEFFRLVGDLPTNVGDWLDGYTYIPGYDPGQRALYALGISFQAFLVLTVLVSLPLVWRRLGWGYAVYTAAVVGIPLVGSKDFQGTGRYMLAAFPAFLVYGQLLERHPRARIPVLAVSSVLLMVWCSFYARAFYVA